VKQWTGPALRVTVFQPCTSNIFFRCQTDWKTFFSGFNHVLVVEINDEGLYGYGQLGGLLRARYCDPKIRGITKTDGLTWKVREIIERAQTVVKAGVRKL